MRFGIAVILVFVLTFSVFAQQSDDWYQGKPIRRIVFDGLVHVDPMELEGITGPFISRTFSDDVYWDILGRLYALEYFESITPTAVRADLAGNEVLLRFAVVERPTVARINFTGNSGLRRTDLSDAISTKVNDVATQVKLRIDEQAIINLYLEKGYPDAKVRSEMQNTGRSSVNVVFYIDEGEKIAIESFHFEGNSVFPSRTLQRQLSLKVKGRIIGDGAFNEAKLIADRQTLTKYYHDRGYINAEVIDVVREIRRDDKNNNLMSITFKIFEGSQYTFGGVTFEGNHIFRDEQLSALIRSKIGEVVNISRIQADLMRVSDLYLENGYIFNQLEPVSVTDEDARVLSFRMNIVERGRAHIENIIVRGNKKTKESVILREIPLEPGDIFSRTKVMNGLRNLYNLEFFSDIFPETPAGSTEALMDLIINVEEQPTTDVRLGLTFSGSADPDAFPVSVMAGWNDRNFLGSGNSVGAEVNITFDTQSISALYTHRWMLGLPLTGNFDLTVHHMVRKAAMQNFAPYFYGNEPNAYPNGFDSYQEYEDAYKTPPDEYLMPYDQWRISLGVGTGYRWLTQYGNLGLGGGVRAGVTLNKFDNSLYLPFDPILREGNNTWTPATSFWGSLSLDQRDIYYDPSSGYYGVQRIGWYGILPLENEHYIRTDTKLEWFYTLFNLPVAENWNFKAVFGVHTGLSFIFAQPQYSTPRIEEASQLAVDGMFIGRGWANEYRRKGFALWENWAEIRIPLAPGILAWDFFFDAAGVKKTPAALFSDFLEDDGSLADTNTFFMRFSLGGGLRFTIPQFPFRFSVAKRFLFRDGEINWLSGGMGGSGLDFVVSFAMSTY